MFAFTDKAHRPQTPEAAGGACEFSGRSPVMERLFASGNG